MSEVPLADGSVDVAVFCLSLMGTDYGAGLGEAHRVLAPGGTLWVAEARVEHAPYATLRMPAARCRMQQHARAGVRAWAGGSGAYSPSMMSFC